MFFSVVITAYNRAEILKQTLSAFFNQSVDVKDYEVIVVDDGSKDNTGKVVKEFQKKHKNLKYIKQKNQGQGAARNTGIKIAKGKVVVIGQDDIVPTYDFLYEHQKFHYLYPDENAAVLGFTAWHPELKVNRFMNWMVNGSFILGLFGGHQFAYEKLYGKKMADYNFFYTSNISLKTTLLKKFPFDTRFSGYGWEDIELGYRLEKEVKLKLYYNSWALGYHHHYMEDSSLKSRMESIGKSAWLIDGKYPELKKVPGFTKKLILQTISFAPFIWLVAALNMMTRGRLYDVYYYLLSKKYFLSGVSQGKKLLKRGLLG